MPQGKSTLADKFKPLLERYAPYLAELEKFGEAYEVGFWTPLKLYVVASYIHTCYLPIMSNRVRNNVYYIDLLSNSGLNRVSVCKDCEDGSKCARCSRRTKKGLSFSFPGSPLLAATGTSNFFKKMYFIDSNTAVCQALDKRLNLLKTNGICQSQFEIFTEDCNSAADKIIREITQTSPRHILVFADNEGLDITWSTIAKFIDTQYADLIINFPTSNLKRAFGQKDTGYQLGKLHAFFGEDVEKKVISDDDLLNYYADKIRSKGKTVETIHIDTDIAFNYDLLIVTKSNAGGFVNYIKTLKELIEHKSAKDVEAAFSILSKGQKTLNQW